MRRARAGLDAAPAEDLEDAMLQVTRLDAAASPGTAAADSDLRLAVSGRLCPGREQLDANQRFRIAVA